MIQELYALLIAHYAVRLTMHEAACLAAVDPDQLSFTHALQVIQEAISEFQMTAPELLPNLYQRMLRDIATGRLPQRRLRSNPRVVKRKMAKSHLKRPEHRHWPQPTRTFREAVAVIRKVLLLNLPSKAYGREYSRICDSGVPSTTLRKCGCARIFYGRARISGASS